MKYQPLIGLPSDTFVYDDQLWHSAGDKYFRAVADVARCAPVMIPSMSNAFCLDGLLDRLDGLLLTGAVSNVHPTLYGVEETLEYAPFDHLRDELTQRLIAKALERGMPLFCICRGFQELNVALGGTLETELQDKEGRLDHRAPKSDDIAVRYGPSHPVLIKQGGMFEKLIGKAQIVVNSIHRQGIAQLAPDLQVEAIAPDGIVEAVSVKGAKSFAVATQWHPEFEATQNPDSVSLFEAFGEAARAYAESRQSLLVMMP